jgi:hypothetical protein
MRSSSTATGWVLAILVGSMRGLLGVGLMVASALTRSGPIHGKEDQMLKINLPHADPGSRETRQRAYQTAQRPTGAWPTSARR